ncbi:large neutral amino acids transporter small subunit 4-like [Discoglossus pictus]
MGQLWRYWVLGSALVETLLFSGCLLGWNCLSPILSDLGVLSGNCHTDSRLSLTWSNESTGVPSPYIGGLTTSTSHPSSPSSFCIIQERALNLGFTIGCIFLGGTFLPLQLVMGYIQLRSMRQVGGALVSVSCLMMVYSCTNSKSLSLFLPPALVALGVGGCCILFTSLLLPLSLNDPPGYLYHFLVIGCFSASATVFTLMKVMYKVGVPFVALILGFGALSCLMFLNSFFCWTMGKNENEAEKIFSVQLKINCCDHLQKKPEVMEQWQQTLGHKFRQSLRDRERILSSKKELSFKKTEGTAPQSPPLRSSILRPVFILHLLTDSVLVIWLHFYISSLNLHLQSVTEYHKKADLYSSVFGALQILSLISAPLISILLSKHRSMKKDGSSTFQSSHNRVRRLSLSFLLRILVVSGFGVSCLIPSLGVQVLGFILHVIIRSSMFIFSTELYHCVFPVSHFGALLGLYTLITSLLTAFQHPLFLLLTSALQGDPYRIHAVFLGLSLCAVSVPLSLWRKRDKRQNPLSRPIALHRAVPSNKLQGIRKVSWNPS